MEAGAAEREKRIQVIPEKRGSDCKDIACSIDGHVEFRMTRLKGKGGRTWGLDGLFHYGLADWKIIVECPIGIKLPTQGISFLL